MGELGECKQEIVINKNNSKLTIKQLKCTFTGREWVLLTSSM